MFDYPNINLPNTEISVPYEAPQSDNDVRYDEDENTITVFVDNDDDDDKDVIGDLYDTISDMLEPFAELVSKDDDDDDDDGDDDDDDDNNDNDNNDNDDDD